ncbi:hypothetical protein F442_20168 [Phytophthora nicotianae P10297]|uniref:Uncharacterized protein n=1 Tax=Phytophthora nicotianae P10297 TaxID=1317064 RepID=W2Y8D8_PHYNI|nr:hypothetical protein F442_20168 [Phytophthora nicotianae P10297]
MSSFDPTTVFYLVIRHCPSLEIPSQLAEFAQMKVLKIYNSTIVNWKENAAISEANHPNLLMLFLARVNMTNGELPLGLHAYRLPETLIDIEFCISNLRSLPEDFDLKWPKHAIVYFEACNFTEVPPPLERLAPFDLSFAFNPISTIPATLIQGNAGYLHVGGTLISELPEAINDVSPTFKLRVDNTNISFFWNWVDPMVANADGVGMSPIVAYNSPYCADLQRIFVGKQQNFSTPIRENQSLFLSDASEGNWVLLKKSVSCDQWPAVYYPIGFEDQFSRIKTS